MSECPAGLDNSWARARDQARGQNEAEDFLI